MDLSVKLKKLVQDSGYTITQHNGQRTYALTTMVCKEPPKGCELFVGRLPRDAMEDELVPLFSKIAPIYELRLMVNFMGENRGYCFVRYFARSAAESAIQHLNNYKLRPGQPIGVYRSLDNTRLFIGGLPVDKDEHEILSVLENHLDGIKQIIMYPSHNHRFLNRGYAFLEFENHRAAAIARRQIPIGSVLWNSPIKLDWADPVPEPDAEIMSKVATLYMRNIPIRLSSVEFQRELFNYVRPGMVSRVYKILDYAFVHFTNRSVAMLSLNLLREFTIGHQLIEVTWARPQIYSRKYTKNTTPEHYCLSLPARSRWLIKKKCLKKQAARGEASDNFDSQSMDSPLIHWSHRQHILEHKFNELMSDRVPSTTTSCYDFFDN